MSGAGNTVTALMNAQADTQFTVTGLAQGKSQVDANAGVNIVFDDAGAVHRLSGHLSHRLHGAWCQSGHPPRILIFFLN
jgi:hypothetical protein